ncbi:MAG: glycerol-3-phosphate 1-O-acyltransferase PlsY [Prevotellaceae bacterium]|jgi:glycerol-3-phosphate acyltransferase PlsY|nr:glycerol-3-phosphate 1-O-acyltransferase PlsY [Prevotellaceae bacterium]
MITITSGSCATAAVTAAPLLTAILGVVAYLLGSIPSAVWIGKSLYGVDVREHGSGNAGTTNVLRVLGAKAAIPVFIVDTLKGLLAVLTVHLIPGVDRSSELFNVVKIACGLLAVVGHMYPVFAGFRGGKGVATTLGVAIAIQPLGALAALGVFIVVFAISRYVSLSSLCAGLSFPLATVFVLREQMLSVRIFVALVCLLLFYTHRKNIQRLISGVEPKTVFGKKS